MIKIRAFELQDIFEMNDIWNEIVKTGEAFPQLDCLDYENGKKFYEEQSYTAVALKEETICGLYILHPNNIGRCGHICNASFAVKFGFRGEKIGEKLVIDCLENAKRLGFKILQFNAVVKSNHKALKLYEKLGFIKLGVIPNGFMMKDGSFQDIIPHYIEL